MLTSASFRDYRSPALEKDSAGSRKPVGSGDVAAQRLPCGFFVALVRPVLGDRAGEPQGSPVLPRSSYPVRSPSRLGSGMAVQNRNWKEATMTPITVLPTASAVPVVNRRQRGSYPRGVISLARYRRERDYLRTLRAEQERKITEAINNAAAWERYADAIAKGATA